jgi:hypothetical protein
MAAEVHKKTKTSSLFFRGAGYFVGSIQFDLLLSEEHSLEAEVSNHPIENGANVSDHVRNLPRKGSLSGLVTNFPMTLAGSLPTDFMEKVAAIGPQSIVESFTSQYGYRPNKGPTAADFEALPRPENRAMDTWGLFKQLMAAKLPVIIITGLEKYEDVIVTKVSTLRDTDTGDALKFSVEFQAIEFVTLTTQEITTTTMPIPSTGAKPKVSKGKVGGKVKNLPKPVLQNGRVTAMQVTQ